MLRGVPRGGNEGGNREGGAAAHDGADIVGVGHLVEENDHALARDLVEVLAGVRVLQSRTSP